MFNRISDIHLVAQNLRRIIERSGTRQEARRTAALQAVDAFERGDWEAALFEQALKVIHPATFDVVMINQNLQLVYIDNFTRLDEAGAVATVLMEYGTLMERIAEGEPQAVG